MAQIQNLRTDMINKATPINSPKQRCRIGYIIKDYRGKSTNDVTGSNMESIHGEVGEVEQSGNTSESCTNAGNSSSKRDKELENVALQTSLNSLRMEARNTSVPEIKGSQETEEDSRPGGFTESGAPSQTQNLRPEVEYETSETKAQEEERTLTDHLNKRLLSSFLEKLNQRDLALPGIQRLDCAVAGEEDSNRAVEEW